MTKLTIHSEDVMRQLLKKLNINPEELRSLQRKHKDWCKTPIEVRSLGGPSVPTCDRAEHKDRIHVEWFWQGITRAADTFHIWGDPPKRFVITALLLGVTRYDKTREA